MRNWLLVTLSLIAIFSLPFSVQASTWHYDFNVNDDLSAFTTVNHTGAPSSSLTTHPGNLNIHTPGGTAYDLCTWVNTNAFRTYRLVDNGAFSLETKMSQSASAGNVISGLYLYSDDGNLSNDWVFGANPDYLKLDRGNGVSTGLLTAPWTHIGNYTDLYFQVNYDGSGGYDFNYKLSDIGPWIDYATLSNSALTHVGLITKTWSNKPMVDASFDYLYYNYTPSTVPEPATFILLGSGLAGLAFYRRKKK